MVAWTATHLVIRKADILLRTRALDKLGESNNADEQDRRASSHDGRGHAVLRANVEVPALQAVLAGGGPLLVRGDGIVLNTRGEDSFSEMGIRVSGGTQLTSDL